MTRENSIKVATWAIPLILGALIAIGAARVQLDGKEDKAEHTADIVSLQSSVASVRSEAEKRAIRDSAGRAEIMRILRDIAGCPRSDKDYCK